MKDTSPTDARSVYLQLVDEAASGHDLFDIHLLASALSIAVTEVGSDEHSVAAAVGLDGPELASLLRDAFPEAKGLRLCIDPVERVRRTPDEESLRALLTHYASDGSRVEHYLAAVVARRCQRSHHLWQDLGLRNRAELSQLMTRHFGALAALNAHDMKWKRFLYRAICDQSEVSVCSAPSCGECSDAPLCFGQESGTSLLTGVPDADAQEKAHATDCRTHHIVGRQPDTTSVLRAAEP